MKINSLLISIISISLLVSACSSREGPQWHKERKKSSYKLATRQLTPQPVYGGLKWVRPPEMTPPRKVENSNAGLVMPVINYNVANKPLKEVILVLAATARYRTYCSSQIADKKITINTLGTIDEIANLIENIADINVTVDHPNKEVRFLPKRQIEPVFDDNGFENNN